MIRSCCCLVVVLFFGVCPFAVRKACADAFAHASPDLHPAQESSFNLEGKVAQKSEGKLTVSTEENIVFHVRYDETTDIRLKDGTQGSDREFRDRIERESARRVQQERRDSCSQDSSALEAHSAVDE